MNDRKPQPMGRSQEVKDTPTLPEKGETSPDERQYTIDMLLAMAQVEHAASAWGFSGVGYWLEKAAEFLKDHGTGEKTSVKSYTKKPETVLAVQWKGDNINEIKLICDAYYGPNDTYMEINTEDGGWQVVYESEWVVKSNDEVVAIPDHHFKARYE